MTVEAFRAATVTGSSHDQDNLYDFATFISASASWRIIDSWKGTTYQAPANPNLISGRYKGDPIADVQWTTRSDVLDGGGIVIEQKNPRPGYPPMQISIQAADVSSFGCVSGHNYRHDRANRALSLRGTVYRVGTQGDWDLDDNEPDFVTKASDTYYHGWHNHGAGGTFRHYFAADDDWIIWFENNDGNKDFFNVAWMGQFNAKSPSQDTVANPAYGILADANGGNMSPDTDATGTFLQGATSAYQLFGALDEGGVWRDWEYLANPGLSEFMFYGSTQGNEFDSTPGIDLMEILIRGRGTGTPPYQGHDDRLIGSLRGMYAGMRLGNGAQFNGGAHMCLGDWYGVIIEWDGTTNV
jgi:hypothetical protein